MTTRYFKYSFVLVLIIVLVFTHFADLANHPKGLHSDEASFLLNTYSISTTGRDEDNRRFPVWLNSYIDSKPALFSYLQLPFVAVLGPTTLAARLPSAILGVTSVLLVYVTLSKIINKKYSAFTAIIFALSPWQLIVSRSTQEVILAFVLFLLALNFFISATRSKRLGLTVLYSLLFITSATVCMYTYHSYKVFLPALLLGWSIIDFVYFDKARREVLEQKKGVILIIFLLVATALLTFALPQSLERFQAINVFHEPAPMLISDEQVRRATGVTPLILLRVFYNKVVTYAMYIISLYFQHFTFDFLFVNGGAPKRYDIPFHGLLYMIEMPLILVGAYLSFQIKRFQKIAVKMWWWLLMAPIPAALTAHEVPSTIRSFPMIIPIVLSIVVALFYAWELRSRLVGKILIVCIAVGYVWGISYFAQQFIAQQPNYQPWNRNVSEEKLAASLVGRSNNYKLIQVSSVRDIYAYIVLQDPNLLPLLQSSYPSRHQETFILGKYVFYPSGCGPDGPAKEKVLRVTLSGCTLSPGYVLLETIRYDDAAEAYDISEFNAEVYGKILP